MKTQQWEIDSSHSGINFSVRHLVVSKVRGRFARWSGSVVSDSDAANAVEGGSATVVIDASSIDTGVADRDAHLRSADFLDVATYPEIKFTSRGVRKASKARFELVGDLTIRGVAREVVLEVEYGGRTQDPWGNERAGFTARTSIDRRDFGLTWNQLLEAGGVVVGERIEIELEVEAVRQAATKAA